MSYAYLLTCMSYAYLLAFVLHICKFLCTHIDAHINGFYNLTLCYYKRHFSGYTHLSRQIICYHSSMKDKIIIIIIATCQKYMETKNKTEITVSRMVCNIKKRVWKECQKLQSIHERETENYKI